jgi:hypothetical protein
MRHTEQGLRFFSPGGMTDDARSVAAYFAADREGPEGVSRCFTEAAVVKDEGRTYRGRAAIRQWKEAVSTRYQYTSEPLACEQRDGSVVITSRLRHFSLIPTTVQNSEQTCTGYGTCSGGQLPSGFLLTTPGGRLEAGAFAGLPLPVRLNAG